MGRPIADRSNYSVEIRRLNAVMAVVAKESRSAEWVAETQAALQTAIGLLATGPVAPIRKSVMRKTSP